MPPNSLISSDERTAWVRLLPLLVWALTLEPAAAQTPAISEQLQIEARQLTYFPDEQRLRAEGGLRLNTSRLVLHGSVLEVDFTTGTLQLDDPRLTVPGPALGRSIRIFGERALCRAGYCEVHTVNGTACPHHPAGYSVRASKLTMHPKGDIDLDQPVWQVGRVPILALPWLRLRPPQRAGLLPPRIGYHHRGGLFAGPAGYLPLGDAASLTGHLAVRTRPGIAAGATLTTPRGYFELDHLIEGGTSFVRTRANARPPLQHSTLVADLDIPSHYRLVDDLAVSPLDRAVTHTTSRALWRTDLYGTIFETGVALISGFERKNAARVRFDHLKTSIALSQPAGRLTDFLWAHFRLGLTRYDGLQAGYLNDLRSALAPSHTRLEGRVGVDVLQRLGPLTVEAGLASVHRAWLADGVRHRDRAVHLLSGTAELALPLVRRYGSLRHRITPYAAYLITPWLVGTLPAWWLDGADRVRLGHQAVVGVRTSLNGLREFPMVRLKLTERLLLPGLDRPSIPGFISGELALALEHWHLSLDGAWDHRHRLPSTAGILTGVRNGGSNHLAIGARWIGTGHGPHLTAPWPGGSPTLTHPWPLSPDEVAELFGKTAFQLTRWVTVNAGARVAVWPDLALFALWYGLMLRPSCDCIGVGLSASHRFKSAIPDVMLNLQLSPD